MTATPPPGQPATPAEARGPVLLRRAARLLLELPGELADQYGEALCRWADELDTAPAAPPVDQPARKRLADAKRHLFAHIIASAHLLDKPFTNAPDQSPWSRMKHAMEGLDAAITALDVARATDPGPAAPTTPLDEAAHSVWLHGNWRGLTSQMTSEEREAFADAVDRVHARLNDDDPEFGALGAAARWWRDERPLSTVPPATDATLSPGTAWIGHAQHDTDAAGTETK